MVSEFFLKRKNFDACVIEILYNIHCLYWLCCSVQQTVIVVTFCDKYMFQRIFSHNIIIIIIIPTEHSSVLLHSHNNSYKIYYIISIYINQNFTIKRHKSTIEKHVKSHVMRMVINKFFDETEAIYIKLCSIYPVIWYHNFSYVHNKNTFSAY